MASTEDLTLTTLTALYAKVMGGLPSKDFLAGRFAVRLYDGMDHCWVDVRSDTSGEDALRLWYRLTEGGSRNVAFREIDYYAIFPADTRMLYRAENMHEDAE